MKAHTLLKAVQGINGASFVGIDTIVDVVLLGGKKNPQQGRVTKQMIGASVMSFTNQKTNAYAAMVARRLESEGKPAEDFTLGERKWGVRVPNMPIVEHNGNYYLEVIFLKGGKVQYMLDGLAVEECQIEGLRKAGEAEQGGLTDKVILRTFAASSITEIRIDGLVFN